MRRRPRQGRHGGSRPALPSSSRPEARDPPPAQPATWRRAPPRSRGRILRPHSRRRSTRVSVHDLPSRVPAAPRRVPVARACASRARGEPRRTARAGRDASATQARREPRAPLPTAEKQRRSQPRTTPPPRSIDPPRLLGASRREAPPACGRRREAPPARGRRREAPPACGRRREAPPRLRPASRRPPACGPEKRTLAVWLGRLVLRFLAREDPIGGDVVPRRLGLTAEHRQHEVGLVPARDSPELGRIACGQDGRGRGLLGE